MFRRLGTTGRIVAFFILFYTAATLALGATVYVIGDKALREQLDDRIDVEADYLVDVYNRRGMASLRDTLQRRDDRGVNELGYLLIGPRGQHLGGELSTTPPPMGWSEIRFRDQEDEIAAARAFTTVLPDGSRLTVAVELAPAYELRQTVVRLLLFGFGTMLVGGIAGGVLLIRAIRSRLSVMNNTAQAIIAGDMTQRVPASPTRDDEFDRLARTLNTMLERNSALIDNLRQVSSDIAHDLRTPLARLLQRMERLSSALQGDPVLHQEVERAIGEANATLSLFGALLRIAEVESGTLRRYFLPLDLSATACSIAESYMAVAEDSGRSLTCRIEDDVRVIGDRDLVSQALVNLLENAIRHTPPGTRILVTVRRERARAVLGVVDNGHGVSAELWGTLAKRFTRGDKSRSGPGFGLGLNLVEAVATVHGGAMRFRDAGPGLIVSLDMPVA
ncbi:HAMP domain-containing protein (plasmid) [Novosphingobium sp. P6W]|nr:HAMP domain-containing protein [Novosphingobium sp. P6W]